MAWAMEVGHYEFNTLNGIYYNQSRSGIVLPCYILHNLLESEVVVLLVFYVCDNAKCFADANIAATLQQWERIFIGRS